MGIPSFVARGLLAVEIFVLRQVALAALTLRVIISRAERATHVAVMLVPQLQVNVARMLTGTSIQSHKKPSALPHCWR